jgi:hypothetical protein
LEVSLAENSDNRVTGSVFSSVLALEKKELLEAGE